MKKINKLLVYSGELRCWVRVDVFTVLPTKDRDCEPYLAIVTAHGEGFIASYDEVQVIGYEEETVKNG